MNQEDITIQNLADAVDSAVMHTPVYDVHTHLYSPPFGELLLWGIDDLLIYHYLIAEGFRHWDIPYEAFWKLGKTDQANLIWTSLFLQHSPLSEACRGVLTTLNALGLDVKSRDLPSIRRWFNGHHVEGHLLRVMDLAGVHTICMTNSPFDEAERSVWSRGAPHDTRFTTALRIDPLLFDWPASAEKLSSWGYPTSAEMKNDSFDAVRRFLADWHVRIKPKYLMVSLPPDFAYPARDSTPVQLLVNAVLPHCREHDSALALMPGVRRAVNPSLRLAGDGVGRADMHAYERLFADFPRNRFLLTALARENQHELCVLARKFRNLHIFGCWWFMNTPSMIDETTRMRLELLGLSMTAQHSDARVLDQLIYKWIHSRRTIAEVLKTKYLELAATGWTITSHELNRDVEALFGGAFEAFLGRSL